MTKQSFIAKCLRRGILPSVPARWRLPFTLWLHLRFENPEPELVYLARIVPRRGVAIDAGANIGLFALSLVQCCERVYAFEINRETSRELKDCAHPRIEILNVGLSNRAGEATLYTPVREDGMVLTGWASLQSGNCPGVTQHRETSVHLRTLDSFQFPECAFLKIDVEGHEVELIEGGLETLRRTRPVILVEVRAANAARVGALLEPLGYRRANLQELVGVPSDGENALFIPGPVK